MGASALRPLDGLLLTIDGLVDKPPARPVVEGVLLDAIDLAHMRLILGPRYYEFREGWPLRRLTRVDCMAVLAESHCACHLLPAGHGMWTCYWEIYSCVSFEPAPIVKMVLARLDMRAKRVQVLKRSDVRAPMPV